MLTADDAADVSVAFGLGDGVLTGPVARGQLGQVWRLDTGGAAWAVKEWFASPDLIAIERDARFAETARAAGVLTPRLRRAPDGSATALVGGTTVRVSEWVDLLPRSRSVDPESVGRVVAALHRAGEPDPRPVDNWFATGMGADAWEDMVARLVAARAPFADELNALLPDLIAVEELIEPHDNPQTCHRDLWADNVLATTTGELCVIDFENLGPADPSHELAMVLFEFGLDDPSRVRRVHRAYVDAGGPGRVTRRGQFTMLIAMQAHIASYACAKWLGESDERERERLASWFLETPADPVTRARIDRILAAVT